MSGRCELILLPYELIEYTYYVPTTLLVYPSQSKIRNFQVHGSIKQHVTDFQIPLDNSQSWILVQAQDPSAIVEVISKRFLQSSVVLSSRSAD